MFFLILVAIGIIGMVLAISLKDNSEEKKNIREERLSAYRAELQKQQENYQEQLGELMQEYGAYSMDIALGYFDNYDTKKHVYVFEGCKILFLNSEPIPFDKIIGFELKDNQSSVTKITSPEYKTSTNTGSMVGRAIVGSVLTGGVGAVVGANTASKTTKVVKEGSRETTIKHNYRISINVDDLSNPVRTIEIGSNEDTADKIANVLNVILHRNKVNVLNP